MGALSGIARAIGGLWARGCLGKGIVIFVALAILGLCGQVLGLNGRAPATQPTSAPAVVVAPSIAPVAPVATDAPTSAPEPTAAPTIVSTEAPAATAVSTAVSTEAPAPIIPTLAGVAPVSGTDCPKDAPIKGNIRDRNPGKGDKIYHLPGDNGYAATKPERCFATAADAEAAGFRPVK